MKRLTFKSLCDLGWSMKVSHENGFGEMESDLKDAFLDSAKPDMEYYEDVAAINAIESMTLALVCTGNVDHLEDAISHAIDTAVEALMNH